MMQCFRFATAVLLGVIPAAAHHCHGYGHHYSHEAGCIDCRGGILASTASAHTLAGTISEIRQARGDAGIVEVWLKTAGSTVLVRLAPAGFLTRNAVTLHEGDAIAVKALSARSAPDESVFAATEITAGGKTVVLRGERGRPMW